MRDNDVFKKLFAIAEVSNLTPEEMNAYQQSLKIKRDNYSGMEYAIITAVTEAVQKAEQKVEQKAVQNEQKVRDEERAKAEREKKEIASELTHNMALKLKTQQISFEIIAEATGLSIEEIVAL